VSTSTYASALGLEAAAVLLCAVVTLWRRSLSAIVRVLAIQGLALASVAMVIGLHRHDVGLIVVGVLVLGAKAVVIPTLITRVVRGDPASRETQPLVNVPASLVAAGALTFLAFASTRSVTSLVPTTAGRLIPIGLSAVLVGFFALVTRRKAVSQIVGILLVDNGVALVAFLATAGVPLLVELGASLDVLLAVIVLRVLATQLRSRLGSLDFDQLTELHD
jgi:hydrogenase-4 component E